MNDLTLKQQRFADEYIVTGNATRSAISAGYSEKYANTNASKLLQNTTIKTYIDSQLDHLHSKKVADQQEILEFLTSIVRGEKSEQTLIGIGEGRQDITDIEIAANQRIRAAELLGKRYTMWTDKQEITGNIGVTIVDDIDDIDDIDDE